MAQKGKYNWLITPIIILVIVILAIAGYNKYIAGPNQKLKELQEESEQKDQVINQLNETIKTNQTITETVTEVRQANTLTIILLLLLIAAIIYIIISQKKNFGKEMVLEEMLKFYQGTAEKNYKDSYWKQVFDYHPGMFYTAFSGNYKGDIIFPTMLLVFCMNYNYADKDKPWLSNIEPHKSYMLGIYTNRQNPKDIIEVYKYMSTAEMLNAMKETSWGIRGIHHKPYKTKTYEEKAMERYQQSKDSLQEAIAVEKAVQEATG